MSRTSSPGAAGGSPSRLLVVMCATSASSRVRRPWSRNPWRPDAWPACRLPAPALASPRRSSGGGPGFVARVADGSGGKVRCDTDAKLLTRDRPRGQAHPRSAPSRRATRASPPSTCTRCVPNALSGGARRRPSHVPRPPSPGASDRTAASRSTFDHQARAQACLFILHVERADERGPRASATPSPPGRDAMRTTTRAWVSWTSSDGPEPHWERRSRCGNRSRSWWPVGRFGRSSSLGARTARAEAARVGYGSPAPGTARAASSSRASVLPPGNACQPHRPWTSAASITPGRRARE